MWREPTNALDILRQEQQRMKMTTGASDLDSLIGGIEEGTSYLFYGDLGVTTVLMHQILVRCVASQKEGGFDSQAIYFNNTDYYTARTTLSPTLLGEFAKKMQIDPERVFRNVLVVAAYNEERQKIVSRKVCDLLRRQQEVKKEEDRVRLVVLHNATCFLPGSSSPMNTIQNLTHVVGALKASCSQKTSLVVTASAVSSVHPWRLPKPMGGSFFQALDECDCPSEEDKESIQRRPSVHQSDARQAPTEGHASRGCVEARFCGRERSVG